MSKYNGNLFVAIEDNTRRVCKVPHCCHNRWRISGFCRKHTSRFNRYGHPEARCIDDRHLTTCFDLVSKVIDKNLEHDGIRAGIRFFTMWLIQADATSNNPRSSLVPALRHMKRNYDSGVKAIDLLKVVASVWLYYARGMSIGGERILNDEHNRRIMGLKVCKFTPIPKGVHYVYPKELREAGAFIQKRIGVLLVNICQTVDQLEEAQQEIVKAMTSELQV